MTMFGSIVFLASCFLDGYGFARAVPAEPEDVCWDVILHDAAGPERSLILDLTRHGDHWERAWGLFADFGHNFHSGRLTEVKWDPQQCAFYVMLTFVGDSWNPSGRAQYQVRLGRQADGAWQGTHRGTFRGNEVAGRATAALRPSQPNKKPGYRPAQPGEHPRILFRKQDVPALREKAKTPFGRAALEGMSDTVGLGVKYQILGDRKYAADALERVRKLMPENHDGGHGRGWGECLHEIGVAYDLCYDAWPEEFKRQAGDYMVWATERLFYRPAMVTGTANWHSCSNYAGPIYQGPGFAGLALWGEKGPQPAKPLAPNAPQAVAPAKDYAPAAGVPVSKFENDEMPGDWLFAGGFRPEGGEDPLAALGGAANARPQVGASVTCRGRTEKFHLLSHESNKGYHRNPVLQRGKDALDVSYANGMTFFSTNYFYTVIDNDRPRWVRWELGAPFARAYLAGMPLAYGDCVRIEKGLYPLLMVASIDIAFSHRRFLLQPRLAEQTEEQVKVQDAARQAEYREQLADWVYELAEWKRTGEADQRFVKLFEMSRRKLYWHCRAGVGTGGFQAEVGHYSPLGIQGPDIYAPAYRTMFCVDLSPYDDITHYVPRKMFGQVYLPWEPGDAKRGKPPRPSTLAQDINGTPVLNARMLAAMFPIVPEPWKPAVLWAWNYHGAISGRDEAVTLLDASARMLAFLNYPLDMQPKPPQGVMPLAWEAPTFGYYGFRNSWEGKDDFLAQVFLKSTLISGWNGANAGTFRLLGLGHVWAHGPTDRDRCRWEENVVQLPENPEINDTALGKLVYLKTEPDGSGVVSVDLADVYAARRPAPEGGRALAPYEKYTSFRRTSAFQDSGIKGLRSIAVDYTGRSGAPCLMVIADKLSGGKSKVWTWQLGDEPRDKGAPPGNLKDTQVEGNTFTIRKADGAVLRATFVAPVGAKLTAEVRKEAMVGRGGSTGGQTLPRPIPGVFAQGPQGTEGDFLVVVTVGRGEPPAVKVQGAGLTAKVVVGQQAIRFDGEKIALETAR
jgi:hypothetical protein